MQVIELESNQHTPYALTAAFAIMAVRQCSAVGSAMILGFITSQSLHCLPSALSRDCLHHGCGRV